MSKATSKLIELKEYRETRNKNRDNDFLLTITSNLLNNLSERNNIYFIANLTNINLKKKNLIKI